MLRKVSLSFWFVSSLAFAEAPLNVQLEGDFTYTDGFQRPSQNTVAPTAATATRTLGLSRLRTQLDWYGDRFLDFRLILRPDTLIPQNPSDEDSSNIRRDYDRRAGRYLARPAPAIQLIDAYHLSLRVVDSLRFQIGVDESLTSPHRSYPEILGFGLTVQPIARYWTLKTRWQTGDLTQGQWSVDLLLLAGHEDRGESLEESSDSHDRAPSLADPYLGSGLRIQWNRQSTALGLTGHFREYSAQTVAGQTVQGRRAELFSQLYGSRLWPSALGIPYKLAFDIRFARESWLLDQSSPQPLEHKSMSLTNAFEMSADMWFLLGLYYGLGDRTDTNDIEEVVALKGHQWETGIRKTWHDKLSLKALYSQEYRQAEEGNRTVGGFGSSEDDHNLARRMAVELSFLIR